MDVVVPRLCFPKVELQVGRLRMAPARFVSIITLICMGGLGVQSSLPLKLGLSLVASFLSLIAVGCSLSQLNLDATHNARGRRQHICDDPNVHVCNPRTYMRTSKQTVFPEDYTGIARYDAAQLGSTPYVRYFYDQPCAILSPTAR